jgi:hypothetical protein
MVSPATSDLARRTKPRTTAALHDLLRRVEGEYREMPGLCVTARQAERLWGLDSTTCGFVLMAVSLKSPPHHPEATRPQFGKRFHVETPVFQLESVDPEQNPSDGQRIITTESNCVSG